MYKTLTKNSKVMETIEWRYKKDQDARKIDIPYDIIGGFGLYWLITHVTFLRCKKGLSKFCPTHPHFLKLISLE